MSERAQALEAALLGLMDAVIEEGDEPSTATAIQLGAALAASRAAIDMPVAAPPVGVTTVIAQVLAHWFTQGGEARFGSLAMPATIGNLKATRDPANADELVSQILSRLPASLSPVEPTPPKRPTTLELSGTMPDIDHGRNCRCAECQIPVEPTPEPLTDAERLELQELKALVMLPTFTAREREIALTVYRAMKEPPAPSGGRPEAQLVLEWRSAAQLADACKQWDRADVWTHCADALNAVIATPVEPAGASEPPSEDFTALLPPRPPAVVKPQRYDLVRYGVTWEGQDNQPLLTPMPDGYWTPWHLAVSAPVEPATVSTYRQATAEERAMARGFASLWDSIDVQDADEWLYALRNRAELLASLDEDDCCEAQDNTPSLGPFTALSTPVEPAGASEPPSEAVQAHGYLSRLLVHAAPQCEPLPDLLGVCTQIDNLLTSLKPTAAPEPCVWRETANGNRDESWSDLYATCGGKAKPVIVFDDDELTTCCFCGSPLKVER